MGKGTLRRVGNDVSVSSKLSNKLLEEGSEQHRIDFGRNY